MAPSREKYTANHHTGASTEHERAVQNLVQRGLLDPVTAFAGYGYPSLPENFFGSPPSTRHRVGQRPPPAPAMPVRGPEINRNLIRRAWDWIRRSWRWEHLARIAWLFKDYWFSIAVFFRKGDVE